MAPTPTGIAGGENMASDARRAPSRADIPFGAVAIGRNEGDRLKSCMNSLLDASAIVYVDSGSSDDSVPMACGRGVEVVQLDMSVPFTPSRARNAGLARLQQIAPELKLVQFVDGDCELTKGWCQQGASFLASHPGVAAVCGRLRERHPERSIYNWLCDREWDGPVGEIKACAGNAMMSVDAVHAVGGYNEALIAGEEAELCIRLREKGWRIWRLDNDMALHDAAIMKLSQWWRRSVRSGYAFAQGANLHGATPERHWVWESRRAFLWGVWIPLACVITSLACGPWGLGFLLIYPLQILRRMTKLSGRLRERFQVAFFELLSRFPESYGQMKFIHDRMFNRRGRIVEYK